MKITTILHKKYIENVPNQGRHILAQQTRDKILVYQAYRNSIADHAIKYQKFGGNDFSYNRMSWIKPNFLWMMYRSGWASKSGQERVLGIWLNKADFDRILENSAMTSFGQTSNLSHEEWKESLDAHPVRVQWDPDHDPHGKKLERKAIQLGIKGPLLEEFGTSMINKIIDLTAFVKDQRVKLENGKDNLLEVPEESPYLPSNSKLRTKIGLTQN